MDTDKLVEQVTQAIMRRLAAAETGGAPAGGHAGPTAVTFGAVPAGAVCEKYTVRQGRTPADVDGADLVVLTIDAFRAFHGGGTPIGVAVAASDTCETCEGAREVDLTGKRLVSERDLRDRKVARTDVVRISEGTILTALAKDYAHSVGATFAVA